MLASIIVYLQILLGKILNKIASSEIKYAKKYLILIKNALLILITFVLIYSSLDFKLLIPFILGFIIFKYFKKMYFLLGLLTFLSFTAKFTLLLLALASLFTLIHSSLTSLKPKEFILKSLYFILPFALIFIETFINQNSSIFIGLLAGGLIAQFKGPWLSLVEQQ
ncbi:MAG: hypothetical protein CMH63_03620 [Nanoarchaeota archaeon]|nr:hypothetical protein [Nanoarchaeota archaeon]